MMKNIVLAVVSLSALAPMIASAKPYHLTPVRWIVETRNNLSEDDKYVTLVGHVTRRIGEEEYWFTDGTGSIRLDSENFDLPIGRRISVGGRIDQAYFGIGHIEVDVRRWHNAPLPQKTVSVMHPAPAHPAPVTPAPAPRPITPAPALAPAAEAPPAPVTTTPPPAPPAAPPTPTTSTTMNPSPVPITAPAAPAAPVTTTNASPLTPPAETK